MNQPVSMNNFLNSFSPASYPSLNPGGLTPGGLPGARREVTMEEAEAAVFAVAPLLPPQSRDLLFLLLNVGKWAQQNPTPIRSPEFQDAFQTMFGQDPYPNGFPPYLG